jgi:serine protease Do/serine protease DegQ
MMHLLAVLRAAAIFTLIPSGLVLLVLPSEARAPLFDQDRGVLTVAPMLDQVTPAVVNIAVMTQIAVQQNPLFKDPFFRRFFGYSDSAPEQQARRIMAAGSGVIIDGSRGLIVTNHHVVKDADKIAVALKDGRQLKAELVGNDPPSEVALLKVPASNLTSIPFADSDELKVGDVVLAVGNPFGVGQTVTSGIISALGRSGLITDGYEDFIQTDAPINPGNSGGALVTTKGELAGINTAIIAPSGGSVGIGFAIPSNIVKTVVEQLIRYGQVRRGRIGVTARSVTPEIAAAEGLPEIKGALIQSVEEHSPADSAGLKLGDVITEVDGKPVMSASDLHNRVGLKESGSKLVVTYVRQGQPHTAAVVTAAP